MKRIIYILSAILFLGVSFESCTEIDVLMDPDMPANRDITYTLGKVIEYDDINVKGIDIAPYFDFFEKLRFNLHFENHEIVSMEFNQDELPLTPFKYARPSGVQKCYLDKEVLPWQLKLESGETVAYYMRGEFYIPFQLDCNTISYEYRFKAVE